MSGSSSWIPYAPQGVKGFDDDDDDDEMNILKLTLVVRGRDAQTQDQSNVFSIKTPGLQLMRRKC
jgi:hypothetical protein